MTFENYGTSGETRLVWTFGGFELDPGRSELRRAGDRVEIQRKPLELLIDLVRHRDRVVTKRELLDRLWPDTAVSESALASALRDLRRVLGDDGRRQATIRTHHCFGYRIVAAVEERVVAPNGPTPPASWSSGASGEGAESPGSDLLAGFAARLLNFLCCEFAAADDDTGRLGSMVEALAVVADQRSLKRQATGELLRH